MTPNPKFSVIIPTYNRANYVVEAVESVLQQTYQGFELIVVNDGSTDDTAEVIRRFGDRIRYMEKANGGKASAVNLGLKYMTGEYVWILDDDDIALPNKLELHAAQFAADPDLKFVYTGYESIEGERSDVPVRSFEARMPPLCDMVMYLFGRFELCSPMLQDEVLRDLDMLEAHVAQHRLSFDEYAHRFLASLKNTTEQTAPSVAKKVEKILNLTHY